MDSVFCLEVAVDVLNLFPRVKCDIPFVAISFLDFPTIVIHFEPSKHQKENVYRFQKGKSCLFKMSPTKLYEQLLVTPLNVVVMDEKLNEHKKNFIIGTCSESLKETIRKIIGDLQSNGVHKASCHGSITTLNIINFMQSSVGSIDVAYKLTSLGHSMLAHLPVVKEEKTSLRPKLEIPKYDVNKLANEDNVLCPPALYYEAKKDPSERLTRSESKVAQAKCKEEEQSCSETNFHKKREKILKEMRAEDFTSAIFSYQQKSESTQTDMNYLNQFPVLQALMKEVLELGLNPLSLNTSEHFVSQVDEVKPLQRSGVKAQASTNTMPVASQFNMTLTKKTSSESKDKNFDKKKFPLKYGLTKSHLLRVAQNKQAGKDSRKKVKKPTQKKQKTSEKKQQATKSVQVELMSERLSSASDISMESMESSDESDHGSVELNFSEMNLKTVDDLSPVPDVGSPRATSRQSIEIRVPTAEPDETSEDSSNSIDGYKYSDDFDDERSWSYERTPSGMTTTTLDSSRQPTPYDMSREMNQSPQRLVVDASLHPTTSEVSPSTSFGFTPRDSIPEEPEKEKEAEEDRTHDPDTTKISSSLRDEVVKAQPMTSDDSASIVTTLPAKLPVPAPSSDSPVIRSLRSSPGTHRPHPPTISHSSSLERVNRKFKKSSESSFHISDISDIRTSELADIRTSDLSDVKTSDDGISPINSADLLGSKVTLPKLAKKYGIK